MPSVLSTHHPEVSNWYHKLEKDGLGFSVTLCACERSMVSAAVESRVREFKGLELSCMQCKKIE